MLVKRASICLLLLLVMLPGLSKLGVAQNSAPSSGEIRVRLLQAVDSAAMRVGQAVQGTVIKSSTPEVPNGSTVFMALLPEPGGFNLRLLRIQANGQLLRASSSMVQLVTGMQNKRGGADEPPTSVSGARVYLPANTEIVVTLAPAPAGARSSLPGGARVGRQAPLAPSHPANTVRDLPPAAPGYPPLHAHYDAQPDCWWKPFFSEKFGLEAAVQTCADRKMTSNVVEMEDGLGLQYLGNTPVAPPDRFVRVLSKPAEQPIEAAIKQQFIMKLPVAAARTACKAVKGMGPTAPGNTGSSPDVPGIIAYNVIATGPYAKLKKFQGEEAEYPCPDLQSNDAIQMYFQYNPEEAKTRFLFFQEDDNGTVFDSSSVHFLHQP